MDIEFFQIQDAANWLMSLGAIPFTFFAIIVIAYAFRIVPIFPNKLIPAVCLVIGPIIFVLVNPHPSSEPARIFYTHSIIGGLFIAVDAWLVHDKFISKWEDRLKARFPGTAVVFTDTAVDGSKVSAAPASRPPRLTDDLDITQEHQ
jgi:hypothetical protein